MEEETGETGGDDGVTDQEVPVDPLPLDPIESGKVCTSVKLLSGIFMEDGEGGRGRVKGHDRGEEGDVWKCRVTVRPLVLLRADAEINRTTLFFPRLLHLQRSGDHPTLRARYSPSFDC